MPAPDTQVTSSQRSRSIWRWLLAIVVVLAAVYWFMGRDDGRGRAPAAGMAGTMPFGGMPAMKVPVRLANVETMTLVQTLKAVGTVTAFNTVTVRPRVEGELVEVAFRDGQRVEKGDLLARIDPRQYQIQLDQALGQQQQNMAQLNNARRDLQRYQTLFKQNSIARQQVDQQVALVEQFEGMQASDQAAVDNARLQLEYTRITAPISGRLGLRNVDEGNIVGPGDTDGLVVITQVQPISVVFSLPQAQLPDVLAQLRSGRSLVVDLYDRQDINLIAQGELTSVDNQIDIATGTLRLKARFDNEDERLFPNQFVNVRLRVDAVPSLAVPLTAVQHGSIGAFVYVVDDEDKVHIQQIETGLVADDHIAVVSGLNAGQRVVVEGTDRLREGAVVDVIAPEDDKTSASAPPDVGNDAADAERVHPARRGAQ